MGNQQEEKLGMIKISDDVITVCAANAVLKIDGVSKLGGGLTDSLSKNILGKDPVNKGVKLSRTDEGLFLDVYIIVKYQVKIPQLAWEIQSFVKKELEEITDLNVMEVNIHVQGVDLPGEDK
ncbi:putative alkaline shock family protein YloU [Clostridiales Family XIII bacterium PM5-7]